MVDPWGLALLSHAGLTLFMAGLIWTCQIVHYPLFDRIGDADYSGYQRSHMHRITWIVAPVMLLEGALAVVLVVGWDGDAAWVPVLAAGLLAVIWLSTALLQGPAHARLVAGFNASTHRRLVATNWIRTAGWTARGVLALAMVHLSLGRTPA